MVLAYPLSRNQFMATLPIAKMSFTLPERMQSNVTKGGERISADIGPRLWVGQVTLDVLEPAEAGPVQAMLDLLRASDASFLAYDVSRPGPYRDMHGVILGASTPSIQTLPAGNQTMSLTGLPPGYVLSAGDRLSFTYTNGSTRYALHRILETVMADATGTTPAFQVLPAIRPGAVTGTAVTLIRPFCKVELIAGSVTDPEVHHTVTRGGALKFQQTLR